MAGRVAIHSTAYGNCTCGHAWITIDKRVVANFCTRALWNTRPEFDEERQRFVRGPVAPSGAARPLYDLVEYGELSRQDAYQACWDFVHELSIDQAITSSDPLIQSLAVLDSRLGKRRLVKLDTAGLHPLARKMYAERCAAEHPDQRSAG